MESVIERQFDLIAVDKSVWSEFAQYHYRSSKLAFADKLFAYRHSSGELAAIIVYSFPHANNKSRNAILADRYSHFSDQLKLSVLNHDLRTISRVVVKPVFRGVSLAANLVRQTISIMPVRYVEVSAVMANVSSFFEAAGMVRFENDIPKEKASIVNYINGIKIDMRSDINMISKQIYSMPSWQQCECLGKLYRFCCHYKRSLRCESPSIERLMLYVEILRKNTVRTAYYFHDKAGGNIPIGYDFVRSLVE